MSLIIEGYSQIIDGLLDWRIVIKKFLESNPERPDYEFMLTLLEDFIENTKGFQQNWGTFETQFIKDGIYPPHH